MLEQFQLKLKVPQLNYIKEGGPRNHKMSFRIGEPSFNYVGEWRFDVNSPISENSSMKLKALTESISTLIDIESKNMVSRVEGILQTHQYKTLCFPNVSDSLGQAILQGNLRLACEQMTSEGHHYDLFSKTWTLSNQYNRRRVETSQVSTTETTLIGKSLVSGEEILVASVSPVLLAMLTKQSTMAIELLTICPMDKDEVIRPFNLSLNQIAQKLQLNTWLQYFNPVPEPIPNPIPEPEPEPVPADNFVSKMEQLKLISKFKM